MAELTTIIAKADGTPNLWLAFFGEHPGHVFRSANPIKAVRRLLEGTEADPGVYALLCDGNEGQQTLRYAVTWDAPMLYFPCSACDGRGEYLGLLVREVCQGCEGRKVIAV